jgi:hypothetical protein
MAAVDLDQDALERFKVGVWDEQMHRPHGPVQDVADLTARCVPRRWWHEAENPTSRRRSSKLAASPFRGRFGVGVQPGGLPETVVE